MPATGHILLKNKEQRDWCDCCFAAASACTAWALPPTPAPVSSGEKSQRGLECEERRLVSPLVAVCQWLEKDVAAPCM
jgi:hypothetical protein